MEPKTLDLIAALLTIPVAYKLLDRVKNKEYGEAEFQEIVDNYFRLRRILADTYSNVVRGVVSF